MPLNEKRIGAIILHECQSVEERAVGYRETIVELVTDILQAERLHRIQSTNIQQKVADLVSAAGSLLAKLQSPKSPAKPRGA